MIPDLENCYGSWRVSTKHEDLGIYTGYVDEIALYLGDYPMDGKLNFEKLDDFKYKPTTQRVDVKITGLYIQDRDIDINKLFKDRPVDVTYFDNTNEFCIQLKDDSEYIKQKALSKLTDIEKKALGLIDE